MRYEMFGGLLITIGQSLDGIIHEGLWEKAQKTFEAFGWEVLRLKYGALQEAAFVWWGKLKTWIDLSKPGLFRPYLHGWCSLASTSTR